jgi:hypothetical protein
MYATKHFSWLKPFYEQLPYEHALSDWDGAAVKCFSSWGLPYYEEFLFGWARENIFCALGGFQEGRTLTNRKVFELLCDHIEHNL